MIKSQLRRYFLVGAATNVFSYAMYILLTGLGVGHKMAMATIYVAGATQSFVLNRYWTFGARDGAARSLPRFVTVYASGFALNFCGLYLLVDRLHLPHLLVQAALIIAVAILLFMLQRNWVFLQRAS